MSLCKSILDHNKANLEDRIKFPSAIDLHKWLVALVKNENPWYYEVAKSAPQEALRALRTAWDRCFNKISGVPNFKKKGRKDSFTLEGSIKIRESRKIQVPKIGILKTYEELPQVRELGGQNTLSAHTRPVKSVTISRAADRWFIAFKIEVEPSNTPKLVDIVGVDLGVKTLATLSTGKAFEGRRFAGGRFPRQHSIAKSYRKYESKLSRLQWLNRHKVIGSANWKKAKFCIARLHRTIANIRKDTLHKLTTNKRQKPRHGCAIRI